MKMNKESNQQIKLALLQGTNEIEPSAGLFDKIKKDIYEQECGETMKNKVTSFKKGRRLAVIAASFVLLGSLTVLGVTMGKSWVGHSNHKYKTFPSQETILKDVGFIPKYPESLPGGFEYDNGGTGESTLSDDAGNILTQTKDITLGYKRANEKASLSLTITQIGEAFLDNKESQLVGNLDEINLYYYNQDYKFVPPNYALTEEDKKAKEKGELEISYGAREVSINNVQGLSWYEDGLQYMIMGSDYNFTVEEMIEMATVIIRQ
ncbi:MAG TPA: hypothetical protein GX707_11700 [Epulopiscium sp.]|nr:hypothetical protein [Candidatus Epulonipiscium sp.]